MEYVSDFLVGFLTAQLSVAGAPILIREIVGNLFGLACAFLGMKRKVWAWPVGIIGNALLFTVFLGGVFHTPQNLDLYGQAGRQVMFIVVSLYGWFSWVKSRNQSGDEVAIEPRWATASERIGMITVAIFATVICANIFEMLGSWGPWADAWILVGSMLATWGMARGWNEFWLIWIAVDAVGVPLLLKGGYYPSAALYLFYGCFVIWGFVSWVRLEHQSDNDQQKSSATDQVPALAAAER